MSESIENHRMQGEIPRDVLGPAGMFSTTYLLYLVMGLNFPDRSKRGNYPRDGDKKEYRR